MCDDAGTCGRLVCSDSQVLLQQQSDTLYKEILEDKHYYTTVTVCLCPSVSPSPAVHPSPSFFGSLLSPLMLRLHSRAVSAVSLCLR